MSQPSTRGQTGEVLTVAVDPTIRLLASGSNDTTIRIWDAESGLAVRVLAQHRHEVHNVTFDPRGRQLATAAYDGIRIWDVASGQQLLSISDVGFCNAVAFHPDGSRIAFGAWGRAVTLCDLSGERMFSLRGHGGAIWDLEFSRDGSRLASASADWTIRVWDTIPYAQRYRQRVVEPQQKE